MEVEHREMMQRSSEAAEGLKRQRLRETLAKGDEDLATGRFTTIKDDDELSEFFARL